MINAGQSPVVEDGVNELIEQAVRLERLTATHDIREAVMNSEISLISVPTPSYDNYAPDLRSVETVIRAIGEVLREKDDHHTVVLRSTLPPGTTEDNIRPLLEESAKRKVGERLSLVFNPEFLREGSSVKDFRNPPQTVIGSIDDRGYEVVAKMYRGLPGEFVRTSCRVAESVKYLCNVFHALKIVFANEAGSVLKQCGLNGRDVMRIFCQDTRLNISPAYLRPGFAFGGSCLPKEVKGFIAMARQLDVKIPSLERLLDSNNTHIERAFDMITRHGRKKIALFGLAFKQGTDDMRDSPLVTLAERLIGKGYQLSIYDNFVQVSRLLGKNKEFIDREIPHLDQLLQNTPEDALAGAEIVVVGHADPDDLQRIISHSGGRHVIDLAGYHELSNAELSYEGICW